MNKEDCIPGTLVRIKKFIPTGSRYGIERSSLVGKEGIIQGHNNHTLDMFVLIDGRSTPVLFRHEELEFIEYDEPEDFPEITFDLIDKTSKAYCGTEYGFWIIADGKRMPLQIQATSHDGEVSCHILFIIDNGKFKFENSGIYETSCQGNIKYFKEYIITSWPMIEQWYTERLDDLVNQVDQLKVTK